MASTQQKIKKITNDLVVMQNATWFDRKDAKVKENPDEFSFLCTHTNVVCTFLDNTILYYIREIVL